MNVATTILLQLGGMRFMAMTGAKDFVGMPDGLMFRIPPANRINKVRIVLTGNDDYTVTFANIRGSSWTVIREMDMVYADMLQEIFTHVTGLDTHL